MVEMLKRVDEIIRDANGLFDLIVKLLSFIFFEPKKNVADQKKETIVSLDA